MTKQVGTSARLLRRQPWKVVESSDTQESDNQHAKIAKRPLSEVSHKTPEWTPKPDGLTKQVSAAPDCLLSHLQKIPGPTNQAEGHNTTNLSQRDRIHISEITHRGFRKAYRNGETTGVVKFSQKEKQIDLRRINISTELAIRNKEERRTKSWLEEDSLENLERD